MTWRVDLGSRSTRGLMRVLNWQNLSLQLAWSNPDNLLGQLGTQVIWRNSGESRFFFFNIFLANSTKTLLTIIRTTLDPTMILMATLVIPKTFPKECYSISWISFTTPLNKFPLYLPFFFIAFFISFPNSSLTKYFDFDSNFSTTYDSFSIALVTKQLWCFFSW